MKNDFDAAVVGGGLAGHAGALELARKGLRVAFIAPKSGADGRTTALMKPSIDFLERLGLWESLKDKAAALATLRIIDGTRNLFRAPTVSFPAGEIGEDAFAQNIPNGDLLGAFASAIKAEGDLVRFESPAVSACEHDGRIEIDLEDGIRIAAALGVAADGRRSVLRKAAGIGVQNWQYPQSALITTFSHRVPHENISTEFHTEDGPCTQVPLPGNRSSLVWVMKPADAQTLMRLGTKNLGERIEERMQSLLGAVEVDMEPQQFPLSGQIAHRFGQGQIVLVGEAAHVFPPIGAQGLNLGLRDVEALSASIDAAGTARGNWAGVAGAYDRSRRLDITSRTIAVDLLNRSLLSTLLPAQLARSAGLALLDKAVPLRQFFMHEGMRPGDALRAFGADWRSRMERYDPRRRSTAKATERSSYENRR